LKSIVRRDEWTLPVQELWKRGRNLLLLYENDNSYQAMTSIASTEQSTWFLHPAVLSNAPWANAQSVEELEPHTHSSVERGDSTVGQHLLQKVEACVTPDDGSSKRAIADYSRAALVTRSLYGSSVWPLHHTFGRGWNSGRGTGCV